MAWVSQYEEYLRAWENSPFVEPAGAGKVVAVMEQFGLSDITAEAKQDPSWVTEWTRDESINFTIADELWSTGSDAADFEGSKRAHADGSLISAAIYYSEPGGVVSDWRTYGNAARPLTRELWRAFGSAHMIRGDLSDQNFRDYLESLMMAGNLPEAITAQLEDQIRAFRLYLRDDRNEPRIEERTLEEEVLSEFGFAPCSVRKIPDAGKQWAKQAAGGLFVNRKPTMKVVAYRTGEDALVICFEVFKFPGLSDSVVVYDWWADGPRREHVEHALQARGIKGPDDEESLHNQAFLDFLEAGYHTNDNSQAAERT